MKKTAIALLALGTALPVFATQATSNVTQVTASSASHPVQVAPAKAASTPTVLHVAQPDRKAADDYAPLARAVYFGGR